NIAPRYERTPSLVVKPPRKPTLLLKNHRQNLHPATPNHSSPCRPHLITVPALRFAFFDAVITGHLSAALRELVGDDEAVDDDEEEEEE
ncbi:MAG: hypothetical protein Q9224_001858, partial [Gallowayella concinna]